MAPARGRFISTPSIAGVEINYQRTRATFRVDYACKQDLTIVNGQRLGQDRS
ncbi:hypothetical protein [Desulfotalea psychrophila]|uniref:hypothetical protein n=1 Tax=Desulfotalea psychrophila TaxID=84980 RepID=UPI0002E71442|nr:hypothetical protein [Desulfotalea psychrophila]